jgi:hypothetical protein
MDMIEDFAKGQSYKMSLIPLPQGLEVLSLLSFSAFSRHCHMI